MGRVRQARGGVQRIVQREAGRWQGRSGQPPAGADGLAGGGDISDHIPRGGHAEQATGALWPSRQKQGLWGGWQPGGRAQQDTWPSSLQGVQDGVTGRAVSRCGGDPARPMLRLWPSDESATGLSQLPAPESGVQGARASGVLVPAS